MTAQPRRKTSQAPKGRNKPAQGNALGNAAPEAQSPEGAGQMATNISEQTQGYDDLGNALPPSAIADTDLPDGWSWVRVREVGAVQLGRQRAPKHENGANMRPYLRVANVFEDRIDLSDVKTMNFTPSEFETFELKPNDILLNEGQSLHLVGRPALYRGEVPGACFQNTLVRFRPGPKVDPKFALTIFRGYMHTGKFQKIARWTTNIAHLGASRFAEMPFPLPPLPDQRRIVAEIEKQFTRLEAGVAALRRVQANLKRYRAAVLKAACEGRLVECDIQSWRTSTIADSIQIIDYRGRTPPFADEGIPHLRSQNVKEGRIVWKGLTYVTSESYDAFMTRGIPRETDVLFTTEAPMGEVAMAPATKFCLAQRIMVLRADPNVLDGRFLMIQLRSPDFQSRLTKSGTGSTVTGVSSRNFQPMAILILPLAEQTRIVAEVERRLSVVEELEAVVTTNLQRATRLRQSILQKAFTGDL
jgi:restriction endonuclease S subunit